jgi:hypothetical protein
LSEEFFVSTLTASTVPRICASASTDVGTVAAATPTVITARALKTGNQQRICAPIDVTFDLPLWDEAIPLPHKRRRRSDLHGLASWTANMTASSSKCDHKWLSQHCFRCVAKGSHMRICADGDNFRDRAFRVKSPVYYVAEPDDTWAGVLPAMAGLILLRTRPRSGSWSRS